MLRKPNTKYLLDFMVENFSHFVQDFARNDENVFRFLSCANLVQGDSTIKNQSKHWHLSETCFYFFKSKIDGIRGWFEVKICQRFFHIKLHKKPIQQAALFLYIISKIYCPFRLSFTLLMNTNMPLNGMRKSRKKEITTYTFTLCVLSHYQTMLTINCVVYFKYIYLSQIQ